GGGQRVERRVALDGVEHPGVALEELGRPRPGREQPADPRLDPPAGAAEVVAADRHGCVVARRRGHRKRRADRMGRYLRTFLKKSIVRFQASAAASLSNRGVVSLLKPCWVLSYLNSWYLTLLALSASSNAGIPALIRSSLPA